jgi:hypothetical protein
MTENSAKCGTNVLNLLFSAMRESSKNIGLHDIFMTPLIAVFQICIHDLNNVLITPS